jgi:hypothetical protein
MPVCNPFPHFCNFDNWSKVLPDLYWNVYSPEQRIKALCMEYAKLIAFTDSLVDTVNDQYTIIETMREQLPELVNEDVIAQIRELITTGEFQEYVDSAIEALDTQYQNLVTRMGTAETGISTNANNILTNTTNINELRTQLADTNGDVQANATAIQTLSDTVGDRIDVLEIDNLKSKNVLAIGDSYLFGNGSDPLRGWGYYMNYVAQFRTYNEFGNGGAGFVATGNGNNPPYGGGMTFARQLEYMTTHLQGDVTPETMDIVVIAGGWNDHAQNGVANAVVNTINVARTNYPNAKIVVAALSNERHDLDSGHINTNINIAYTAARCGVAVPFHSADWLAVRNDVTSADGIHPAIGGYAHIGYMMAAYLAGSEIMPDSGSMGYGCTKGDNVSATNFRTYIKDGIAYLMGEFTSSSWSSSTTLINLSQAFAVAHPFYVMAQFVGSGFKDVVPVYVGNGVVQPRTPFGGSYPEGSCTLYLPVISYPLGIQ